MFFAENMLRLPIHVCKMHQKIFPHSRTEVKVGAKMHFRCVQLYTAHKSNEKNEEEGASKNVITQSAWPKFRQFQETVTNEKVMIADFLEKLPEIGTKMVLKASKSTFKLP